MVKPQRASVPKVGAWSLLWVLGATPTWAQVAPVPPAPANEQVIVPQVERRAVQVPRLPSRDIGIGFFAGTYSTQNFGASGVTGLRLAYHITEDFFVEATLGRSKVSDEAFRNVLPGGIFANRSDKLSYSHFSAGYNLFPGEVFLGKGRAKTTQIYVVGGIGSTNFAGQKKQTFNVGFGGRLMLADWLAVQTDVRDHIYKLDLLGTRKTTQNLEATAGLTVYF
jgi:outer membrane beta-barrel protein